MREHAKHLCLLVFVALLGFCWQARGSAASDAETHGPKIDKAKLETYLRYIEGYTEGVRLAIDDPTPSVYKGFSRVVVHVSMGTQKVGDRLYYVTPDGERFVSGTVWQLGENPWADTLALLPQDGPAFGPANAKVTMVVFSDFECPYCREFAKTLRDNIPKQYPTDVRVVFEDFPIESIHPWSIAAAEAAHCVGDVDASAFWAFHDWIFEHQGEVDGWYKQGQEPKNLRDETLAIGTEHKLDPAKVGACIDTHATRKEIEESLRAGRVLQIDKTPTIFLNGRMIPGAVSAKTLDAVIDLERNRPVGITGPAATKCCEVTAPTIFKK